VLSSFLFLDVPNFDFFACHLWLSCAKMFCPEQTTVLNDVTIRLLLKIALKLIHFVIVITIDIPRVSSRLEM
jgi:hypothetical protein